jgi:predicted  nucleic acid-binding Zn-ribbon protein
MMNEELKKIAKVQKVDTAINELKRKFASIDPGRGPMAAVEQAKQNLEAAAGAHSVLRQEAEDLELSTKGIEQKIESEQKRLYSGGVYNAKDAEAIDREVANLKQRRSKNDERLLELWEEVPPAKAHEEAVAEELRAAEARLAEYRTKYDTFRVEFESRMTDLVAKREAVVQSTDATLMEKYERNRDKRHGIGVSLVVDGMCTACSTPVPKKQLGDVVAGNALESCQNCFRFLYVDEEAAVAG